MRPWTVLDRLLSYRGLSASALAWPLLVPPGLAQAQALCEPPDARLVSIQGTVELKRAGTDVWTAAMLEEAFCLGDTLRVGTASRAGLALANDSTLRVDEGTTAQLRRGAEEGRSLLNLLIGAIYFFSHRPRALEVDTPFVNAAAEGTEFLVRVGAERAEVVMLDGQVLLQNPQGELRIASGQAAVIPAGAAPAPMIVARPRDAVAWALYYPPILAELAGGGAPPRPLPPGLQDAIDRVAANDYAGALAALEGVPEAARDARYYTFRAGVLLNVGRVGDAAAAIRRALALDPNAGEALAQRAIIQVVQNRNADALADARRAVELRPDSSTARIALSYALQANFQLEEARAVLREAVERMPEDALAWARLAELEQMFGELGRSRDAAERAVALAPELARTQIVLGFAALTRIDIDQAKASFERAIALDSANPLPRLGLGLAIIRSGALERGRKEIEIAAALDPSDSLIRSYLGKAYFEERRDPQDAEQYRIAKQLDPNDPTPWLYDAIRLQTVNRPVEALRNIQRSIELNDNRAVYRSRLLLDEDLAVRQVSLARIYNNLGFEQLGLNEATKSLGLDPANSSAHRFLSDTYAGIPRHEIARASELLQSQLLQPININPVPPTLPITDLNIVTGVGPAAPAFNEFTPLFDRNRAQLTATGVVGDADGNENTFGDELVASAVVNKFSLSAGQFHYQTDGFRTNNDQETDLYNVFGQWAVTPKLNLQAEYRHRDTKRGDLSQFFTPESVFPGIRDRIEQDTIRAGASLAPSDSHTFLFSGFYTDRVQTPRQLVITSEGTDLDDSRRDEKGYQFEGQYLFTSEVANAVAGLGRYHINARDSDEPDFERHQNNIYLYTKLLVPPKIIATLGLSYDDYESGLIEISKLNPKFGLEWYVHPNLRLRAAAFQTVKRALVVEQTIEPTEVAGFNQLFDDFNGTISKRYGIGADFRINKDTFAGLEYSYRRLEPPVDDARENLFRGYLYRTFLEDFAFSAGYVYDDYSSDSFNTLAPVSLQTHSAPFVLRYFNEIGLFSELGATLVAQRVHQKDFGFLSFPEGSDTFVLLDMAAGYRLPNRRGIISLEVRNLLDKSFSYQDDDSRSSESHPSAFIPDRVILGRITLNF